MLKPSKSSLLILLAVALSVVLIRLYVMNAYNNYDKTIITPTVNRYKELVAINDSVQADQDSIIFHLEDSLAHMNDRIDLNKKKIKQIKANHNEKLNRINKFSTTDIGKFLSDYYKDRITE